MPVILIKSLMLNFSVLPEEVLYEYKPYIFVLADIPTV